MLKFIASYITILALLLSMAVPNSHAMMMGSELKENLANEQDHCAEMMSSKQTNISKPLSESPTSANDCCDECDCILASITIVYFNQFKNLSLFQLAHLNQVASLITNYLNPTQDFFIPPKIV